MTGPDIPFDHLDDAGKVKLSQAELAATLAELDAKLARLAALRTVAEDPDGLVRVTLGPDGRLLSLFIDDSATTRLTNLALEQKLNELLAAANEAVWQSRKGVIDSL
jgi:DNA-binding protein YbaB